MPIRMRFIVTQNTALAPGLSEYLLVTRCQLKRRFYGKAGSIRFVDQLAWTRCQFQISFQILIASLWVAAFAAPLAIDYVYSFYATRSLSAYNAFYTSLNRIVWGVAVSWVIFACHKLKSGGLFRKFLSHYIWMPLSKMCLSIYIVHYVYIILSTLNLKHFYDFDVSFLIRLFPTDILVSLMLALVLHLFVEAPSILIVKYFIR